MQKLKKLDRKHIPIDVNILMPFLVWTVVDYWSLPQWIAVVYVTVWVLAFIGAVYITINSETVSL